LVRDLTEAEAPDIVATVSVLAATAPDVLVLSGIDHDAGGAALGALVLALLLGEAGGEAFHEVEARRGDRGRGLPPQRT